MPFRLKPGTLEPENGDYIAFYMYKCRSMLMLRIDGKTRVQVFYNTVLRNFPLFCPKCKLKSRKTTAAFRA